MEDLNLYLKDVLTERPHTRVPSADTVLRGIEELATENISYTVEKTGNVYDFPSVLDGAYFHMLIDGVGIIDVGTEGEDLHGRVTHGKVGGLHAAAHSDELHLCAR